MIGFNALLSAEGIDSKVVKLVRHQTTKYGRERTPYWLSRTALPDFECYQRIQSRPVFKGAEVIAAFVATPLSEESSGQAPRHRPKPPSSHPIPLNSPFQSSIPTKSKQASRYRTHSE